VRHDPKDLASDIALKLRVANGTHTAVAHVMAVLSLVNTEALGSASLSSRVLLNYLDSLYQTQILPAAINDGMSAGETNAAWDDWRQRLQHPQFGLSTFFIAQNGAAKCGIRLGPTINSLVCATDRYLSVSTAFAVAAVLRFLTPVKRSKLMPKIKEGGAYLGWLDVDRSVHSDDGTNESHHSPADTVTYADGLRYNLSEGWYEFKCDCTIRVETPADGWADVTDIEGDIALPAVLATLNSPRCTYDLKEVVNLYLRHSRGGDLLPLPEQGSSEEKHSRTRKYNSFVTAVCRLYHLMINGDGAMILLSEMDTKQKIYKNGFATTCAYQETD